MKVSMLQTRNMTVLQIEMMEENTALKVTLETLLQLPKGNWREQSWQTLDPKISKNSEDDRCKMMDCKNLTEN